MLPTHLFIKQYFTSHSGLSLPFKIECDALTDADIDTLAFLISGRYSFGSVYGVPTGGERLAKALTPYITSGPRLVVDDVLTTGKSMKQAKTSETDIGVVIFSRGISVPAWIKPIFRYDWDRVFTE